MTERIHHKKRSCPIEDCEYNGGDLKRHLCSKRHKDDVSPEDVDALVQTVDRGKNKKGRNRLSTRWCPVEGCQFLTSYLRNHLKQKHKIANVWTLDSLMKISILYKPNKLPPSNAPSIRLETRTTNRTQNAKTTTNTTMISGNQAVEPFLKPNTSRQIDIGSCLDSTNI